MSLENAGAEVKPAANTELAIANLSVLCFICSSSGNKKSQITDGTQLHDNGTEHR
jgi:hypothetical protein